MENYRKMEIYKRIKPQQDEEDRQAWIKANPDKYTRGPDPGEDRAPKTVREFRRWVDATIPRARSTSNYTKTTNKILSVLEENDKPMSAGELAEITQLSYACITEHLRRSDRVTFIKGGKKGNTKLHSIKRNQR